mmetsp:Transcript_7749/g.15650  ORF Transcript_7749/g.15650 Transcript_7749/m.15650 type:complete len:86 (-) Transcript_7749:1300-1557(-)
MGKRKKKSAPPPAKKVQKMDRVFDCPICQHEKTVDCKVEAKKGSGTAMCRHCGASHRKEIHALEEGVDVYHDWIDVMVEAQRHAR